MSTTTFTNIISSSTTAVGDAFGAYLPVVIPFIILVAAALVAVRYLRGGFRRKV